LTGEDEGIFYDLKRFLDGSPKTIQAGEFKSHSATRSKPGKMKAVE
jgi:hypothetical protein